MAINHIHPLLSVIIPYYNIEDKLFDNCLKSVCSQDTSSEVEVIVVNDGSPTSPSHIISKSDYKDIIYIEQSNLGLSDARNTALDIAKGEYCLFLDGDDYIVPNGINELVDWIKKNDNKQYPADALRFGFYITSSLDLQNNKTELSTTRHIVSEYFWDNNMTCTVWQTLFRRDLISTRPDILRFYPGILHEDELWTPQLFLRTKTIDITSKRLYCYYSNNLSIMRNPNYEKSDKDWMIVVKELKRISDSRGNKKDFFEARFRKVILSRINLLLYQRTGIARIERYVKDLKEAGIKSFCLLQGGATWKMRLFAVLCNYRITRRLLFLFVHK